MLRTLTRYRNPDQTSDLNHRLRGLITKGVFTGGQVTPIAGILEVDVQPFAAAGADGMVTILEGAAERLSIAVGTQWVLLHAEYKANAAPVAVLEVLTTSAYDFLNTIEKNARIKLAKVTIAAGATQATTANISFTGADRIDPVGRIPYRGNVATVTSLPDHSDPADGLTTVNRANDLYFVEDERVFYHWNVGGLPQWSRVISAAEEIALRNHKLNQDDGTEAPDFLEAQHLTVAQRESTDDGPASVKTFAGEGTDYGTGNALMDEQYPVAFQTKQQFTGLVAVTAVQLTGRFYVGLGILGTAKQYFQVLQDGVDALLLGTDKGPIRVGSVYEQTNTFQVDPSTDADALGFIEDPWIRLDFTETVDSIFTGNLEILCLVKKALGQIAPSDSADGQIAGLIRPAKDIPHETSNGSASFVPPVFNLTTTNLQGAIEFLLVEINKRSKKRGGVFQGTDASTPGVEATGGASAPGVLGHGSATGSGILGDGNDVTLGSDGGIGVSGVGGDTDDTLFDGGTGVKGTGGDGTGTNSGGGIGVEGVGGAGDTDGPCLLGTGGGASGNGIEGVGIGTGIGVKGTSVGGYGVLAESTNTWGLRASSANNYGIRASTGSSAHAAVYGIGKQGGVAIEGQGSATITDPAGNGIKGTGGDVLSGGSADGGFGVTGTGGDALAGEGGTGVIGVGGASDSGDSGYGVIAEGDTTNPGRSAFRLVPQDADPTAGQSGDIYFNKSDKRTYEYDGTLWRRIGPQKLASIDPSTTIGPGVTGETLFDVSYVIKANSLRIGSTIRVRASASITYGGSGTLEYRVRVGGLGGTLIGTAGVAAGLVSGHVLTWDFTTTIRSVGPWPTNAGHLTTGFYGIGPGNSAIGSGTNKDIGLNFREIAVGIDTTADQTLVITANFSNGVSNDTTLKSFIVDIG